MKQPPELQSAKPLKWAPRHGTDVWQLFQACIGGDLETACTLLAKNPSLARTHYSYRKLLYFAARENRPDVATLLLDRDPDPTGLATTSDTSFHGVVSMGLGCKPKYLRTSSQWSAWYETTDARRGDT